MVWIRSVALAVENEHSVRERPVFDFCIAERRLLAVSSQSLLFVRVLLLLLLWWLLVGQIDDLHVCFPLS